MTDLTKREFNFNTDIPVSLTIRVKDAEDASQLKQQILDNQIKAEKWDKLMTHSKYHNTFGCSYHFTVKKKLPELERKIQFLQSENKRFKEIVDRVKRFRAEYEDEVRERQRDPNYQGWCNESICLDMLNQILQSERVATKEGQR